MINAQQEINKENNLRCKPTVFQTDLLSLWKGNLTHASENTFVNAIKIYGYNNSTLEINDNILICGGVNPEQVYDYIRKLLFYSLYEFSIVMLDWNHKQKKSYERIFNYFYKRGRYGLVETDSKLIKKFYIIPVPWTAYIPNIFLLFDKPGLNNVFMEFMRSTNSNFLVGIIISKVKY